LKFLFVKNAIFVKFIKKKISRFSNQLIFKIMKQIIWSVLGLSLLVSCKKESVEPTGEMNEAYDRGTVEMYVESSVYPIVEDINQIFKTYYNDADIKIVEDKHGLGNEAIRVLKSMPKWKAAQHNGRTVRSQFTLPIKVKVNN